MIVRLNPGGGRGRADLAVRLCADAAGRAVCGTLLSFIPHSTRRYSSTHAQCGPAALLVGLGGLAAVLTCGYAAQWNGPFVCLCSPPSPAQTPQQCPAPYPRPPCPLPSSEPPFPPAPSPAPMPPCPSPGPPAPRTPHPPSRLPPSGLPLLGLPLWASPQGRGPHHRQTGKQPRSARREATSRGSFLWILETEHLPLLNHKSYPI